MLWVRGAERAEIESTLEADETVDNVSVLGDFTEEWLFQMEWVYRADLIVEMITRSEATILDAVGHEDEWNLRVLYPERSQFSKTHEFCQEHGLDFDVESIRELDEEPAGRYGLTSDQYEVLAAAADHGYFEVPREVTLAELADELDVSHQALSERLRRAMAALVDDTLFVTPGDQVE
jgi:predicted DNA binding protein